MQEQIYFRNRKMKTINPTDASIILTYRCPMRCVMCNIWKNPTEKKEEIKAVDLKTLPQLKFINLTGGEPFIREDLEEIVAECYKHTSRIVISTSGWFEDRVVALAKKFPKNRWVIPQIETVISDDSIDTFTGYDIEATCRKHVMVHPELEDKFNAIINALTTKPE